MTVKVMTDDLDLGGHHLRDWRYLSDIPQGGAVVGQALVWDGSAWAPGTVSGGGGGVSSWNDLTDKPTVFPPETHTHVVADITDWLTTPLHILSLEVENGVEVNVANAATTDAAPIGLTVYDGVGLPHVLGMGTYGLMSSSDFYVNPASTSAVLYVGDSSVDGGATFALNGRFISAVTGANFYSGFLLSAGIDVVGSYGIRTGGNARFGGTLVVNSTGAFNGLITASGGVATNTVSEATANSGVTVDTMLIKDGVPYTNTVSEATTGTGVTVDGVLCKDNGVTSAWTGVGASRTNVVSSLAHTTSGFETGTTYRNIDVTAAVTAGSGSLVFQTYNLLNLSLTVTNSTPTFFGPTLHVISSTVNAGGLGFTIPSGSTQPVHFIFSNPSATQAFGEGYFSVDVTGTSGDVISAYTRARVSGAANGIGYRGYAVDASGSTGTLIGVNGYVVISTGSTSSAAMAFDATILGSAITYDKRMAFRGSNHVLVRGGSLFLASGTPATPGAVTTTHLTPGSANSELYVAGAAEVDGELFMDGNTSVSVVTTTATSYNASTATVIRANAASANITVNLPAASGRTGRVYIVKKVDSSANTVTIDANASETIDGATTVVLTTQYEVQRLVCNGTNWDLV